MNVFPRLIPIGLLLFGMYAQAQAPAFMPLGDSLNISYEGCGSVDSPRAFRQTIERELQQYLNSRLECIAGLSAQARWDVSDLTAFLRNDPVHASGIWLHQLTGALEPLHLHCIGAAELIPGMRRTLQADEWAVTIMRSSDRSAQIALAQERFEGARPGDLADALIHEFLHLRGYRHTAGRDMPYLALAACGNLDRHLSVRQQEEVRELATRLSSIGLEWTSEDYLHGFSELSMKTGIPSAVPLTAAFSAGFEYSAPEERFRRVRAALAGLFAGGMRLPLEDLVPLAVSYSGYEAPHEWGDTLTRTALYFEPLADAVKAAFEGHADEVSRLVLSATSVRRGSRFYVGQRAILSLVDDLHRQSRRAEAFEVLKRTIHDEPVLSP